MCHDVVVRRTKLFRVQTLPPPTGFFPTFLTSDGKLVTVTRSDESEQTEVDGSCARVCCHTLCEFCKPRCSNLSTSVSGKWSVGRFCHKCIYVSIHNVTMTPRSRRCSRSLSVRRCGRGRWGRQLAYTYRRTGRASRARQRFFSLSASPSSSLSDSFEVRSTWMLWRSILSAWKSMSSRRVHRRGRCAREMLQLRRASARQHQTGFRLGERDQRSSAAVRLQALRKLRGNAWRMDTATAL